MTTLHEYKQPPKPPRSLWKRWLGWVGSRLMNSRINGLTDVGSRLMRKSQRDGR